MGVHEPPEFFTALVLQDDTRDKSARASMVGWLEVGWAFLDHDLVDFARRIPHEYKYRHGRTKYLLKSALRGVVPAAVLERRKKGFGIPLTRWLRTWDERDFGRGAELVGNPGWTAAALAGHQSGQRDQRLALWGLLALGRHGGASQ